jgi:large subunit ribosomal protein L9
MKLKGRHFVYELVEDQNVKKKPNIDVILTTYVDGLGKRGEIVNVKPQYAYEKLLLPGLAVYKTPKNIEKYATNVEQNDDEEKHSSPFAQRVRIINLNHVVTLFPNSLLF